MHTVYSLSLSLIYSSLVGYVYSTYCMSLGKPDGLEFGLPLNNNTLLTRFSDAELVHTVHDGTTHRLYAS